MPFFEFNAFRAAGIKDVLPFWRKGDLAFFRKVRKNEQERPILELTRPEWAETEIDSVRVRTKIENATDEEKLEITHLVKGDILPTVSTRDKRRTTANIWTSGNRIYSVNNPVKFHAYLGDIKNDSQQSGEANYVREFIKTVTEFEKKEYNNYLDWLYHEMERQVD